MAFSGGGSRLIAAIKFSLLAVLLVPLPANAAFNGSGTYVRLYDWTTDAANGVNISSSRMDAEDDGFATGLSSCVTRDGQTTISANLPMAGFRHTGVGNAQARTDYAAAAQVQDSSLIWAGTATGTNTIAITTSPITTSYTAGQTYHFIAAAANTGATTINVNTIGAKNITKNGATALTGGEIASGAIVTVKYDGTQFQLMPTNGAQLPGTITNDSAGAGMVGERVSSSVLTGAAVSLTSSTDTNITSISLTAGDWDIGVVASFKGGTTTTVNSISTSLSTTTATIDTAPGRYAATSFAGGTPFNFSSILTLSTGRTPIRLPSTTTIYLVANSIFGVSTCSGYGIIDAVRVR